MKVANRRNTVKCDEGWAVVEKENAVLEIKGERKVNDKGRVVA